MILSPSQKPPIGAKLNYGHPLAKGLIGCWLFNEGSGNKVFDYSGNGNHGTITNVAAQSATSGWNAGPDGAALLFDGSNDTALIPESLTLSPECITVFERVKFNAFTNTFNSLWTKQKTSSPYGSAHLVKNTGKIALYIRDTAVTDYHYDGTGTHTLSTGQWYNLSFTYDKQKAIGYVNCEVDGIINAAGKGLSVVSTTTDFNGSTAYASRCFNGLLSEVLIYNRALSAAEIAYLNAFPYCMFDFQNMVNMNYSDGLWHPEPMYSTSIIDGAEWGVDATANYRPFLIF